jgi:PilZ domain
VSTTELTTISPQTTTTAKKAARAAGAERRTMARYHCGREAVCHVSSPGKRGRISARIVDISAGGIGLILRERFEEGTLLDVRLQSTVLNRSLPVKVVHVAEVAPNFYLLGGAFTAPFSTTELHQLVS